MEIIDLGASQIPALMNMGLRTRIDLDVWTQMGTGLATSMICFQVILDYGKIQIEMGSRMRAMPSPTILANGSTQMEMVLVTIQWMQMPINSPMMEHNGLMSTEMDTETTPLETCRMHTH